MRDIYRSPDRENETWEICRIVFGSMGLLYSRQYPTVTHAVQLEELRLLFLAREQNKNTLQSGFESNGCDCGTFRFYTAGNKLISYCLYAEIDQAEKSTRSKRDDDWTTSATTCRCPRQNLAQVMMLISLRRIEVHNNLRVDDKVD